MVRAAVIVLLLGGCDRVFGLVPLEARPPDAAVDASTLQCPISYDLTVDGYPSRYRFVTAATTWDAAEVACASDTSASTHLVVLDDDDERLGLVATLTMAGSTSSVWIGLSDRVTEDAFLWVTAQPVGVPPRANPPWPIGQPDDMNGGQDCVRIQGATSAAPTLFDDGECSSQFDYVCECDGYPPAPANF